MTNFLEKSFNSKKEKETANSPEKIQETSINKEEEVGLNLTKQILEIQKKPQKTKEDRQKIVELAKKLENLFSEESFPQTLESYENLKDSALYDKENKQWNKWMKTADDSLKKEVVDTDRYSSTQLLGILTEALVGNKEKAQKRLEKLQNSPLYNSIKKEWVAMMDDKKEVKGYYYYSESQLLEIIVNAILGNRSGAKKKLEELKESLFYNETDKKWNYSHYTAGMSQNVKSEIYSHNQLLGVLAEAVTGNLNEAQKKLEELKNSPLYNKEKGLWREFANEKENGINSSYYSYDQLWGILTEFIVGDKQEAQKKLEELKNSSLYDKENRKWDLTINNHIDGKQSPNTYYADLQLLNIIIEAMKEKPDNFIKIFLGEDKNQQNEEK